MTTANAIFLIGLIFMALGLMVSAYFFKRQALAFGAVAGWLLVALLGFSQSAATWDIYYGLGWFGIGLVIVSVLETLSLGQKEAEAEKDDLDAYIEEQDEYDERMKKWHKATKPRRRRRKSKLSLFARTGRMR